jgi:hypothetical protein
MWYQGSGYQGYHGEDSGEIATRGHNVTLTSTPESDSTDIEEGPLIHSGVLG